MALQTDRKSTKARDLAEGLEEFQAARADDEYACALYEEVPDEYENYAEWRWGGPNWADEHDDVSGTDYDDDLPCDASFTDLAGFGDDLLPDYDYTDYLYGL